MLKKIKNCLYKFLNYKTNIIDFLFVAIFFIFLFIPASNIDKTSVSNPERRTLHSFKPIISQNKINSEFGKDFENWFNDRFYTRNFFIGLNKKIVNSTSKIYNDGKVIFDKNEGWFFYQREIDGTYKNPDENEFLLIKNNINKFNDFCRKNNVKMYFVIEPDKSNIYREKLPFYNFKNKQTYGEKLFYYLKNNPDKHFSVIYPENEVMQAKNISPQLLFFKTDNHQTETSGYVTYLAIIKEIKKDFPEIPIAKQSDFYVKKNKYVNLGEEGTEDFTIGNLNNISIEDEKYLDFDYDYFYPKKETGVVFKPYGDPYLLKNKAYSPKGKRKAILLGSSFMEKDYVFLRHSFKNTDKIRLNTGYEKNFHTNRFENYIKKEKPDILIICINESEIYGYVSSMYDNSIELEP